jgi:hypothetical protein
MGKKLTVVLFGLFALFLVTVFPSNSASAIEYSGSGASLITYCDFRDENGAVVRAFNGTTVGVLVGNGGCYLTAGGYANSPRWKILGVNFNNTLPENSIVTFTIRTNDNNFNGIQPPGMLSNQIDQLPSGWVIQTLSFYNTANYTNNTYGLSQASFLIPSREVVISNFSWVTLATDPNSQTLTDIKNALNSTNTKLDSISTKITQQQQQQHDDAVNQLNATKDQTKIIKDQIDRENTGQDNIQNQDKSGTQQGLGGAQTSLFGIFTGFVGAITSASPTNCNLDLDMGYVDFGNQNVCAFSVPTFVQIIGSIIAIVIFVPLSLALLSRIIGQIRSMQR